MKISELKSCLQLEEIVVIDPEREVEGAYVGDLLSWVMTRLSANHACIIFTENAEVSDDIISKAKQEGINLFKTNRSSFDVAYLMGKMLYEK